MKKTQNSIKTQQLKEKNQGLGKFLPSSGTKPCVLLLKTHSSWLKLNRKLKVYVILGKETHNSSKKLKTQGKTFGKKKLKVKEKTQNFDIFIGQEEKLAKK